MTNSISNLSLAQLKQAVAIKEQIESLQLQLARLTGGSPRPAVAAPRSAGSRRRPAISAAGRARIAAAQKARWARQRKGASPAPAAAASKPAKSGVSPATRARLSALAKARWAKAKKAGKTSLA